MYGILDMSEHKIKILWEKGKDIFIDNQYSRSHTWILDGGLEIPASASPFIVPLPLSNPRAIDPEEAFVASISSCHMLWFLHIAARRKICIEAYSDEAFGIMKENSSGYFYIEKVTLQPSVKFSGNKIPTNDEHLFMHNEAHKKCFIANSVNTKIVFNLNARQS